MATGCNGNCVAVLQHCRSPTSLKPLHRHPYSSVPSSASDLLNHQCRTCERGPSPSAAQTQRIETLRPHLYLYPPGLSGLSRGLSRGYPGGYPRGYLGYPKGYPGYPTIWLLGGRKFTAQKLLEIAENSPNLPPQLAQTATANKPKPHPTRTR